ncbi:hypothetical protein IG605_004245 [Pectobacterium quasiaquaticum]|uniref:Uncharacterized protein n=1 Tax=Pectobacterium quasiaquaticum TaxID=2774015 RepID=A0A9Q2EXV3_9GAMM|nr:MULTISPECIES: hypothetical protein [Pectobacterium]MBE5202943.1 hypothetical protein [Pectobacterium quasiaquaticum]MBE5209480.1 hypothetical protein [Pectobacterium quasiaquaticum]MBE5223140.1 hypothetical protein [Pectobacterium quasiaquaticum]MBN3065948.1 hypothetical protein [Pectobacterium aquaticum]URG49811.1 hypothetical protein IG609_004395 [Pectobacterium quasiaquaticum]
MKMKTLFLGLLLGTSYIGMAAADSFASATASAQSTHDGKTERVTKTESSSGQGPSHVGASAHAGTVGEPQKASNSESHFRDKTDAIKADIKARESENKNREAKVKADVKARESEARKDAEKGWADAKAKADNFNSRAEKQARETARSVHNAAEKHQR